MICSTCCFLRFSISFEHKENTQKDNINDDEAITPATACKLVANGTRSVSTTNPTIAFITVPTTA